MNIQVFSGDICSKTAGLSPYNDIRVELFLAGCKMAREGHPCPGCFNSPLWDSKGGRSQDISEVIQYIEKMTDNRYITIVGGEPLDQYPEVIELTKRLKEEKFHIVLFTHYTMSEVIQNYGQVLKHIDMLIDGKFDMEKRIFDTDLRPGILHGVGGSNQKIWFNCSGEFVDVTDCDDLRPFYEGGGEHKRINL